MNDRNKLLAGVKILDISHQYAGGLAACLLADMGADVIVAENPKGSPMRSMLPRKEGHSLWWKAAHRGKRSISLNLNSEKGREIFFQLAPHFDAVVENFRPGTLEKWRIGPDDMEAAGLSLVLLRISGFGQFGPESYRAGYGTVAEAMSGFAYLTGEPDGPPMFTSTTLADSITGTYGALGLLAALLSRSRTPAKGVEVIDCALIEAMLRIIPTQLQVYDQFGTIPGRIGNYLGSHGTLRNLWKTKDNKYYVISAIGAPVVRRVLVAIGADDLIEILDGGVAGDGEKWEKFLDKCNQRLIEWSLTLPLNEIEIKMVEAEVAFQTVYDASDIVSDPHYIARKSFVKVPDKDLGGILMPNAVPKFSRHEYNIPHAGLGIGENNSEVYGELLGFDAEKLASLKEEGII